MQLSELLLPTVWKYKTFVKLIRTYWFLWSSFHPVDGIKIMEEEWDYLIVLDTCRYDYFKKYNNLKGVLEKRISQGSATYEWLEKNFANKKFSDTVYITANPRIRTDWFRKWVLKNKNPFFKIEDVWKDVWDAKLNAVTPWDTTKAVLDIINNKYKSKRLIIHYLQPHAPYIDRNGNRLYGYDDRDFNMFRIGKLTENQIKDAYILNLKMVLDEVKKLIPHLKGKIVITADHGECFGEKLLYGHPGKTYVKELVEIPWFIINNKIGGKINLNRSIRKFVNKESIKYSE